MGLYTEFWDDYEERVPNEAYSWTLDDIKKFRRLKRENKKYNYKCNKCRRGTNSLSNDMCTWCYNKFKKQQRIERGLNRSKSRNKKNT